MTKGGGVQAFWSILSSTIRLSPNEIHIWRARLDLSNHELDRYLQFLSFDELRRADRFHFDHDRNLFIFRRGILRTILGLYSNMPPGLLAFSYGTCGKPVLGDGIGPPRIHFNLSSSKGLVLLAFCRGQEVGIDVEQIRPMPEMQEISDRFFTAFEINALRGLPSAKRRQAFFSAWTRKEAFIKAIGDGLSYALNKFCVSLAPGEPCRLLDIEGNPEEAARWAILPLTPSPGYISALAVRSHTYRLRCWDWTGHTLSSQEALHV